jgi:hypothetical protein
VRRSLLTNGAADEPQATVNGNVAELQQMIRDGRVKELRTTGGFKGEVQQGV